jgi:RHS repeat-associated protein
MSTVADATGSRTLTYFDNDQLKSVTAPGATQPFTYDYNSDGTPNTRTYPDGTATAYSYDNDGRTTGTTTAGKTVTYGYDAAGNPTTTALPAGQRSETQTFDTAGRLSKITEANGATTTATAYGYDPNGRVTDQTAISAGGVQTPGTQYAYDSAGRLTRSCLPASVGADCASTTAGKTLAYDKAGNLLSTADTTTPMDWTGATQTVSADLNGDGITDVITADATNTIRTYLGQGDGTFLPAAQITGTGTGFKQLMPIEYTGDGKTDLLAIDNATGHLLRYTGDGKGGFAAPADLGAGWGVMTLTPGDFNGDGKNDFLAISSSSGNMNFYPGTGTGTLGAATGLGTGWGVMTLTPGDFNGDGKLDVLAVSSSSHRMNFYPGNGNGTLGTATLQADSWATYGQPATGHFDAGATLDIVAPDTSNHLRLWHGDGAGHLTGATITTGGTTNTYNTADQLSQTLTGRTATAYGYDLDGNQTTAGSTTNTYDPGGRLTTSTTGSTAYAFTYDADGNRATVKKNGTLADTTRWDINNPLPQIATETNATGALIGDYQYNPAGAPQSANTTSSNAFYYLHNQQNSITAVLDGTGAQTYHYSYDTYGTATATADVTGGQQSAFGFTGQYKDPALTGRLDLRDRILDTTTGRFTTRDPIPPPAGSANPSTYAYANNDPVNLSDPTGDCPLCISALVGAGIGALVGGTVYAFQHRDGNFNWGDFAASTGKGAIIGFGAGLLMPAGGASAAFLGFEEGTASYLATSATINGLVGMGYTWAVNTAQCQPTNPRDLLFGFAGGFFGTYAGPAFAWAKGLLADTGKDATTMAADSHTAAGGEINWGTTSTSIGSDESTRTVGSLTANAGQHDVIVHGTQSGYIVVDGRLTNPGQIVEAVTSNPNYAGECLRLLVCHSGASGVGQDVADGMKVPVWAPTTKVGVLRQLGPGQEAMLEPGGYWRLFLPVNQPH